jgi:hypothetical protein
VRKHAAREALVARLPRPDGGAAALVEQLHSDHHRRVVEHGKLARLFTEEIVRIGREKFPFLPADQQFARVFEDKNYAALSAQAHRRPGPSTVYAMPNSSSGTAYAKSDPAPDADTAYAEERLKLIARRTRS